MFSKVVAPENMKVQERSSRFKGRLIDVEESDDEPGIAVDLRNNPSVKISRSTREARKSKFTGEINGEISTPGLIPFEMQIDFGYSKPFAFSIGTKGILINIHFYQLQFHHLQVA